MKNLQQLGRATLVLAIFALIGVAPAWAQTPTRAGTVISNTATASYTDANGNTYADVDASVDVTVAFVAGWDITMDAVATPAGPSTGNTFDVDALNTGNDWDAFELASTAPAGITITGYILGGTTYATLVNLNAAIAALNGNQGVDMGNSITITVVYDVAGGYAGDPLPIDIGVISIGDDDVEDGETITVTPTVGYGVSVTRSGAASVDRLPTTSQTYTASFTVENTGNAADVFDVDVAASNTVVTVVSVAGAAGGTVSLAPGATATVTVTYSVSAGASSILSVTATSQGDAAETDADALTVNVVQPSLAMAKELFLAGGTIQIDPSNDEVVPGQEVWYKITVTNGGGANAVDISISDPLPAQVTFLSTAGDAAGWTIVENSGTVTAELASLAAGSRFFWIKVQVK